VDLGPTLSIRFSGPKVAFGESAPSAVKAVYSWLIVGSDWYSNFPGTDDGSGPASIIVSGSAAKGVLSVQRAFLMVLDSHTYDGVTFLNTNYPSGLRHPCSNISADL
jgi:hypothetical protein